jgi:Rha family phage regulatory protein
MIKKLENPDIVNDSNHIGTEVNKTNSETMSSLEIAKLAGKRHYDVLKAIRKMEITWKKITGRKFTLSEYTDAKGEKRPMYQFDKTGCLYVATKFGLIIL